MRGEEPRRQSEALRMALGLTVLHEVDVFVLCSPLSAEGEIGMTLGMMRELGMRIYSNIPGNEQLPYLSAEETGKMLPEYDTILTY